MVGKCPLHGAHILPFGNPDPFFILSICQYIRQERGDHTLHSFIGTREEDIFVLLPLR